MHIPTRLDSTFHSAREEDLPELTCQVDLAKALDYAYGNTLEDLRTTQDSLEAAEEKQLWGTRGIVWLTGASLACPVASQLLFCCF